MRSASTRDFLQAIAVQRSDHFPSGIKEWSGDCGPTLFSGRLYMVLRRTRPASAFVGNYLLQQIVDWNPFVVRPTSKGSIVRCHHRPCAVATELQNPARVHADQVDHFFRRSLVEIRRRDRTLQNARHRPQPMGELVSVVGTELVGQRKVAANVIGKSIATAPRRADRIVHRDQQRFVLLRARDLDPSIKNRQHDRNFQLTLLARPKRFLSRNQDVIVILIAEVLDVNSSVVDRRHQHQLTRHLFERLVGDHHSIWIVGLRLGKWHVERMLVVESVLPPNFQWATELAGMHLLRADIQLDLRKVHDFGRRLKMCSSSEGGKLHRLTPDPSS